MTAGRLSGKTAIVTGAASGLGQAMAETFAAECANVIIADILDDQGEAIAASICTSGREARFVHLDVSEEAEWRSAIDLAMACYGKIDIVVNNAGTILNRSPIETMSGDDWDRLMRVNLKGVFLGTKHAIPAMRKSGGGSIINISSIAAMGQAQIQEPAYAASKAAVRQFTKVAATQHAHENIRCNSLHPGPTDGGMLRHSFAPEPEALAKRLTRVPMGRLGRIEEIVAGVVFLASEESSFMTGAELVIDGGAIAQ